MEVVLDFKSASNIPDHQGEVIAITEDGRTIFACFYNGSGWNNIGSPVAIWAEKPKFKTKVILDLEPN